nr:NUDIX domain-containing protein [Chloroflexia bacterium]
MDEAQDPNELFDVVLADGTLTGRTKPRAAVHRDGDWHRAVQVWVAGHDERGDPFLLFQRRSPAKDTFPGCLGATVGGHFRAGEDLARAVREVEEEIGIVPDLAALRPLGVRICTSELEPGIIDRELQEVFLLIDNRPLTAYRPHPAELAGLVRFRLADLLPVLAGKASSLFGAVLTVGSDHISEELFSVADFVIRLDRYYYRVAIAVCNALRG